MEKNRYLTYCKIMNELKKTYELMYEYDSLPHNYGSEVLYQSEAHLIQCIGKNQGIKVTEIAKLLKKTTSACSQIVRKLVKKGFIKQKRNINNNREYNLYLTKEGLLVYDHHEKFDQLSYEHNSKELYDFTDDDLETYIKIQHKLNKLISLDVEHSYKYFNLEEGKDVSEK